MSNVIKINNQDLQVREFSDQRVITFKDIDNLHERVDGTAGRNFSENKKHFVEGIDYFHLSYEDLRSTNFVERANPKGLILITESGYLMLVKSLTDDLAWKVQRELVNSYFRVKEQKPACIEDLIIMQAQSLKDIRQQLNEVNHNALAANAKAEETKQEVQAIREVIEIKPSDNWRNETNSLIKKVCYKLGDYSKPKEEIYKALEERARCNLKIRLNNLRGRAYENCWTQSKINALNYLDVITDDVKLIEIYTSIVKEMAIKYKVA